MTPAEHDQAQDESDAGMEQWEAERPERLRKFAHELRTGFVRHTLGSQDITAMLAEVERLRAENAILRRIPDKVASDERERCASLCERLPYGSGLAGRTYAEAIRGVGLGATLAKGGTP
jgi:hypothetical protein